MSPQQVTAGFAHRFARLFHKGIHHELDFNRSKAVGEVRQPLKLHVGDCQVPPIGVANCAQFLVAERIQGRPDSLLQLTPGEI